MGIVTKEPRPELEKEDPGKGKRGAKNAVQTDLGAKQSEQREERDAARGVQVLERFVNAERKSTETRCSN